MSRRARWIALQVGGWSVVALLAFGVAAPNSGEPRDPSVIHRLLGPIAPIAAGIQWVRFDAALRDGEPELAYARAESALSLDPGAYEGWSLLAGHQAIERGARAREPDPARRMAWIRAGIATALEGEEVAREPGRLALLAGLLTVDKLDDDPELVWPAGRKAAWEDAARDFERAQAAGYAPGAELARKARERADRESR